MSTSTVSPSTQPSSTTTPLSPTTPPPPAYTPNTTLPLPQPTTNLPYTANSEFFFNPYADPDTDSEDDDTTLVINAGTQVRGSGNVVAVPLIDAPRVSAALFAVLKAQNGSAAAAGTGRKGRLNVQIHCGVTIVGERNVIGLTGLGVRPKAATTAGAQKKPEEETVGLEAERSAGTKRKAEEDITTLASKTVKVEAV